MFDPRQLEADVRELYRTELFARVETSTRETEEGIYVQVKLREHLLVSEVIFHGNERLDDKQLKKHCGIEKGDPVNPYSVEMARKRLVEYYQEKGMNHADVQVREGHRPNDTRVWFEISEGNVERVWEIGFEGNQVISSAILKTKIKSKDARSGVTAYAMNIANLMQIEEDTQRLVAYYRSLGYFRARVNHRLRYDDKGVWIYLTFVVDEGATVFCAQHFDRWEPVLLHRTTDVGTNLERRRSIQSGKMSRDQRTMRNEFYGREGFVFVDISPEPHHLADEPNKIDFGLSHLGRRPLPTRRTNHCATRG